jgi:hypothetical protein
MISLEEIFVKGFPLDVPQARVFRAAVGQGTGEF